MHIITILTINEIKGMSICHGYNPIVLFHDLFASRFI